MAVGDEDYSGDYTDSDYDYNDDLSRYSEEDQNYIRNARTLINGRPAGEDEKSERGSFFANKFGKKTDDEGNNKWGMLKKGEQDASKKPNTGGKGGDKKASLGEKENNVKSDANDDSTAGKFKNAVQGVKDLKSGKVGSAKGRFKKAGPIITILALCLGFGGSSFLGQMSMPFSLISQFQDTFDSISVSQNARSKSLLKFQTGEIKDGVKDCIKAHYFKADEFRVTKRQKAKLAKNGITFEDEGGITVMKHVRANGEVQTIVADSKHAGEGRITFDDAFANDIEFRNNYTEGSRTWRGSIKAWFDSSMKKLLGRLGINRNNWRDFDANSKNSAEDMKTKMSGDVESDGADAKSKNSTGDYEDYDADGDGNSDGTRLSDVESGTPEDTSFKTSDATEIDANTGKTKLQGKLQSLAGKFDTASSILSTGVNIVCGVSDFIGAVSMIVAAYQAVQIISMAANVFEGIQKAQIGDGASSPLHDLGNSLTRKTKNTYTETTSVKKDGNDYVADGTNTTTRERSAMEAAGISAIYGGTSVNMSDPSVKSFNMNTMLNTVYGSIGSIAANISNGVAAFKTCTAARMAAAVVSAGMTIVKIVLCFTGVGCAISGGMELIKAAGSALGSVAFSAAVSIAIAHLVPFIAGILTRKVVTEVAGEDLGNMLVSGANMYMGQNHQQSGGSVASKGAFIAYLQEQDRVVAENARYERETRSPFDITSKYTFLGSLASQMIPIASQMSTFTGMINGASTVVGNAVRSITPHSSAASAAIVAQIAEDQTEKNCPEMHDIGAVADAFCNPYIVTDTSTLEDNPATVVNEVNALKGFENPDKEEDAKIDAGSDLARYIIYCGQRTSPWGKVDQNIAGDVQSAQVGNAVGDAALGAVPIVGDALDIFNNTEKLRYMGYITGKACVANNDGEDMGDKTAKWKDNKKYQRFIEDQRIAESAGLIEESAVTKFISEYYEKHPLDNSFEGILARYSGLTKDKVVATLDALEVLAFKEEYEPAGLYPYPVEDEGEKEYRIEDNDTIVNDYYIAYTNNVVYDSRRNRNFAV